MTSRPFRAAMRGFPIALMNGGNADTNMSTPRRSTKCLALRVGAAFWPGVDSESFGTPPAYPADQVYARQC